MFIISTKVLESGRKDANKALVLLLPTFVKYVYKDTKMHCVIKFQLFSIAFWTFYSKKMKKIPFVSLKPHLLNPFCFTTNDKHRGKKQNCDC